MARKKTITHDQILNAAYNLVVEEGFKSFTARNIAHRMDCSTQPIYLEFTCMDDLKQAVMARIKDFLAIEMTKSYTGDRVIDLALSYIHFAIDNRPLYTAVFVEDHFGVEEMREYALSTAMSVFNEYKPAEEMSAKQRQNTITSLWIVATGIANLMASDFISISDEKMVAVLKSVTASFLAEGEFDDIKDLNFMETLAG